MVEAPIETPPNRDVATRRAEIKLAALVGREPVSRPSCACGRRLPCDRRMCR
jgi:hypothetical protein